MGRSTFNLIRQLFRGASPSPIKRDSAPEPKLSHKPKPDIELPPRALTPDEPLAFGYKINWFAVKTSDGQAVAGALALETIRPCNWCVGMECAEQSDKRWVFVSPCCEGWTFAISSTD